MTQKLNSEGKAIEENPGDLVFMNNLVDVTLKAQFIKTDKLWTSLKLKPFALWYTQQRNKNAGFGRGHNSTIFDNRLVWNIDNQTLRKLSSKKQMVS